MRRTSVKTFIASFAFLVLGVVAFATAENNYQPDYTFGVHVVRPWNNWDYLAICSFVLFTSLVLVSFRFFNRND
jgi:hypothetical protein